MHPCEIMCKLRVLNELFLQKFVLLGTVLKILIGLRIGHWIEPKLQARDNSRKLPALKYNCKIQLGHMEARLIFDKIEIILYKNIVYKNFGSILGSSH